MSPEANTETRQIEKDAFTHLLETDGWRLFLAYVEQSWGAEACIQKIDRALQELKPGDEGGERMTVLQIRAAARQIQALTRYPAERIAQGTPRTTRKAMFSELRRGTR